MGAFRTVILTIVVAGIGIAPTFAWLWPKWADSHTYSHGLLILALSGWLLWRLRGQLADEPVQPAAWALVPLIGLLFAWTLSYAASIEIGVEVLFPAILLCAVLASCGAGVARIVAFPILLLYSAVSIWDLINGYLQSMTVAAVDAILDVVGVPAFIQGNIVQIPSGVFEIAGGCSGLHFFIVAATLAAVYGYLYYDSKNRTVALVVIAAVMSVVMNWLRVAIIITAGHLTEMQSYLVQVDHYFFGWVLFAVMLLPFFMVARRLEGDYQGRTIESLAPVQTAVPFTAITVVCLVALLPTLVWGRLSLARPEPIDLHAPAVPGWQGPIEFTGNWAPKFETPDAEILASYRHFDTTVDIYANWYRSQEQGRELIGYGSDLAGPDHRPEYDRVHIDSNRTNHGKLLEIREIIAHYGTAGRRVIWYYYVVGDKAVTNPVMAKLRQGFRSMVGQNGTGLVSVSVACNESDTECSQARDVLEKEFSQFDVELRKVLRSGIEPKA